MAHALGQLQTNRPIGEIAQNSGYHGRVQRASVSIMVYCRSMCAERICYPQRIAKKGDDYGQYRQKWVYDGRAWEWLSTQR